jgi:hypothetical protein
MDLKLIQLSDTAMVLLRECVEAEIAWFLAIKERDSGTDIDKVNSAAEVSARHRELRDLRETLIDELWYLSISHDIPLIRHLDWHLTLNQDLMAEMQKMLRLRQAIHRVSFVERMSFLNNLSKAYQMALLQSINDQSHDDKD